MKYYSIDKFLCLAICLVAITGCGKYGYNFIDGYDTSSADSASISSDTSQSSPDYSMYSQAAIYPGLVEDTVTRLEGYPVAFNLRYIKNPDQLHISVVPQAWLSSGLYAPTGEPIKIEVPAGLYGLTAQIGCATDNLSSLETADLLRSPILYTVKQLFPGTNYIRSPFGGPIYIKLSFSQDQTVTLKFTGACKMTDFILGVTDPDTWKVDIKKSGVPWFEMRAPHMIFTLPTEKAARIGISNPKELMQTWEDIFNLDYSDWEGLSENPENVLDQSIGLPWRCVADIQPSVGYAHSGFPVVFKDDDHWFETFITNYQSLITSGSWGIEHEVGHNNQQSNWSLSVWGETTNNMFTFKTGNRLGFRPQSTKWTESVKGISMMSWVARGDTATKNLLSNDTLSDMPIHKCLFFAQLFDIYGYGMMTEFYRQTRYADHTSNNDQDRVDFVYEVASKYAHTDLYFFFRYWGLRPSIQSRAVLASLGLPALNKKIWTYNPGTMSGGTDPF